MEDVYRPLADDLEAPHSPPILDEGENSNDGSENKAISVDNLDDFFTNIYIFHKSHGLKTFILRLIYQFCSLTCPIIFIGFLTLCMDWQNFFSCGSSFTKGQDTAMKNNTNTNLGPSNGDSSKDACKKIFGFFIKPHWFWVFCNVLYWLYWLFHLSKFKSRLQTAWKMHGFYSKTLEMSTSQVAQFSWDQVVERIFQYYHDDKISFIRKHDIQMENVTSYIMRHDNFLTSLIHHDVIDRGECSSILVWLVMELAIKKISRNGYTTRNVTNVDGQSTPTNGNRWLWKLASLAVVPSLCQW